MSSTIKKTDIPSKKMPIDYSDKKPVEVPMNNSRLSRIEEQRTQKRLFIVLGILGGIVLLLAIVGIPAFIFATTIFAPNANKVSNEKDDATPPAAPLFSQIVSATNSATIKIEGYAEADATLKLSVNGEEKKEVVLGSDGAFSFKDITLSVGENIITAIAVDKGGNESTEATPLRIQYKKSKPKLEVTEPEEGKTFEKKDQQITIKGSTDPDVDVWVNDRFVSVRADGSFEHSYKLSDGENTLMIKAVDAATNETKLERKVTYRP